MRPPGQVGKLNRGIQVNHRLPPPMIQRQKPVAVAKPLESVPSNLFVRRKRLTPLPESQPGQKDMARRLRRFELFGALPDSALLRLAGAARVKACRAGEFLWHQGEEDREALFIERGLAIASRRAREGVDRTYGLFGPGDALGIYALWAGMKYPTDVLALNDGMTALQLDANALLGCLADEPAWAASLMVEMGRFTDALIHKIDIVSAGPTPRRVAALFVLLTGRYGAREKNGSALLPFRLTLQQIGGIVDTRIETVARVLSDWRSQGWLRSDSQGFHFSDISRLDALLTH